MLLLASIGRIAGISGMLHGLFAVKSGRGWRESFLIGLLAGADISLDRRQLGPDLALVMAGAVLVFAPTCAMIRRRSGPFIGRTFHLPARSETDG